MFHPQFEISPGLLNLIAEIAGVRELILSSAILPQWDIRLKREAFLRMAHHSTAIEGNPLEPKQVAGLVGGKDVAARERDKREVLNYLDTLRWIDQLGERGLKRLADNTILDIHNRLMEGLLPLESLGKIRQEPVAIFDRGGRVVCQTPPAGQIPQLIGSLLAWLNGPADALHPVIVSAIAHYELVRIHPFLDGNGRTARLLATLILYLRGFDTKRFFALDEFYNDNLDRYYHALATADRTGDLSGWLEYFAEGVAVSLKRVKEAIRELSLDSRLRESKGQIYLEPRQIRVLRSLQHQQRIRIADVQGMFSVTRETANRILEPLLSAGLIVRKGLGRATYYELG